MHAPDEAITPSRSAAIARRLIRGWEYRHAGAVAGIRFTAAGFDLGIGVVLLAYGRRAGTDQDRRKCYGWAAFFLGMSALQFTGGCLDMIAVRSAPPRN
jgi:hypothetical protein